MAMTPASDAHRFLQALLPEREPAAAKFLRALLQPEVLQPVDRHLQVNREDNGDLTIAGYGATFGNTDRQRETFDRGAFNRSLIAHRADGEVPYMLMDHDLPAGQIGRWTYLAEDDTGLLLKGRIFAGVQRGKDCIALIEGGAMDGLSVGYSVKKDQRVGGVRHLKEVDLLEISLVRRPANPMARIAKRG